MRTDTIAPFTIDPPASATSRHAGVNKSREAMNTVLPARKRFKAVTAAAALLVAAQAASTTADAASPACGPRTQLLDQLTKKYKEAPVAVGLANNGALVEVLTSNDGATWTILFSLPDGTSCLAVAGQEWRALKHVASREYGT
jgi:hypothetical protein